MNQTEITSSAAQAPAKVTKKRIILSMGGKGGVGNSRKMCRPLSISDILLEGLENDKMTRRKHAIETL